MATTIRPSELRIPIGYPNDDPGNGAGMVQADFGTDDRVSVAELLDRPTFGLLEDEVQRRHMSMWVTYLVEAGGAAGIGTGYRSKVIQEARWRENPKQFSNPATSYHVEVPPTNRGLAMDNVPGDFWPWMHANAHRFGLIHLTKNEQHHTQLVELPRGRSTYNKDPNGYWAKVKRLDLPVLGTRSVAAWLADDDPIDLDADVAPIPAPEPTPVPADCKVSRELTVGAAGNDVRCLQRALRAAGRSITVDGEFGPATEGHVKAVQAAKGLAVDGRAGPRTLAALGIFDGTVPAPKPPAPTPEPCKITTELVRGATGDPVRCLQQALRDHGQPKVVVDGSFGPATEGAVKAFQQAASLKIDGRAGPATLTRLGVWGGAPLPTKPFVCSLPVAGLSEGDTGPTVRDLQTFLKVNGWYAKNVDGRYGPATRQGVQQFQKVLKRDGWDPGPVDGLYGPRTRQAGCRKLESLA